MTLEFPDTMPENIKHSLRMDLLMFGGCCWLTRDDGTIEMVPPEHWQKATADEGATLFRSHDGPMP